MMKKLSEKEWDKFELTSVFNDIRISTSNDLGNVPLGKVPCIGRSQLNNGFAGEYLVDSNKINKGQCVTISMVGIPQAFYQKFDFACSQNIMLLRNDIFDESCLKAFCAILNMQLKQFNYGYPVGLDRFKKKSVMLPVDDKGEPDYNYMEQYAAGIKEVKLAKYRDFIIEQMAELVYKDIPTLEEKEWDEFVLDDIFNVGAGKRLETRNKVEGTRPFIGATDNRNGITGFVGNDNTSRDENVLGVNYNGAPCIAFYHPYECIFTDDVKRLHLKHHEDNKYVLLFFTSVFAMQRVKYSYGYKFKEKRMLRQKLRLPVTAENKPDYEYMEQYIKNMIYKKYEQYLNYLNKK